MGESWSRRQLIGLTLLPVSAFTIYLGWRFLTPGSLARTQGVAASVYELGWKIVFRMNLTGDHRITDFGSRFLEMHAGFYSPHVFALIVGATLATAFFLALSFGLTVDPLERRSIFNTASLLFLVTVPFYAHMLLFYQHTAIHRWAIAKAMFAYALVPFSLLPISIVVFLRLSQRHRAAKFNFMTRYSTIAAILLAIGSLCGAEVSRGLSMGRS